MQAYSVNSLTCFMTALLGSLRKLCTSLLNFVHQPVFLRLFRTHPEVTVSVFGYGLNALPGVLCDELVESLTHEQNFLCLNLYVRRHAA